MLARASLPPALIVLMALLAATPTAANAAATCSQRPSRNTLTSECFGACASSTSLCVSYAAEPASNASRIGDGNYYYQGCAFASMSTCKASAACELQCLQTTNAQQQAWVLDVAQPQKDKAETSLFLHVENIALPSTLRNLSIIGTTELTRKVPISFAAGVFQDSATLERINILDVAIENITSNIFPPSLKSLTIQRTKLQQFDPRGNQRFSELRMLDLRENALSEIPIIVYEMRGLTELYLQGNPIRDAHITAPQLAYLQALRTFQGSMNLSSSAACQDGYKQFSWDATRTVCYGGDDLIGADVDSSGSDNEVSVYDSSTSTSSSTGVVLVIVAVAAFVVAAVLAGMLLLKRVKRKGNEPHPLAAQDSKRKVAASKLRAKFAASATMSMTMSMSTVSDLTDPLQSSRRNNNTFKDIPAEHVRVCALVALNGAVRVAHAELNGKPALMAQLQDTAMQHSCELALDVVPVVSQLRHPQLLAVVGIVDPAGSIEPPYHALSVVLEPMNQGSLEAYLLRCGRELTWAGFKLRAALDVAGCLMYLHTKHRLSYGALTGKSVFVDDDKGCKLNTLLASIPDDAALDSTVAVNCDQELDDDATLRSFRAPEFSAGAPRRSSADMFAFGVLLAQLDSCRSTAEMWRSSSALEPRVSSSQQHQKQLAALLFTEQCPPVVKELACACVQLDPSLRPSASYVVAMLQQLC